MNENNKYEVLTPTGFQNFIGIQRIEKPVYIHILFENKQEIKCSLQHLFQLDDTTFARAADLVVGTSIKSKNNCEKIISISKIEEDIELYDLLAVSNGSLYYTDDLISHNCDVDFLTSGATVIEPEILQWYEAEMVRDPIQKRGVGDDLWIWKFPDYTRSYMVVADVSRGDSSDYSAFHVIDIETLEQCAEYKGKIDTSAYARMLVAISIEYNNALLVIENAGVSMATVQAAVDLNYNNLHYSYRNDPFMDVNIHLAKNFDLKNKKDMVPGFTTSATIRPVLVSKLDMYFREKGPKIYSKRTLDELRVFIYKGGRGEAERGFNDDLTMALAIGLFLRDTAIKLRMLGIELTKTTLDRTHKIIHKTSNSNADPWKVPNGRGGTDDLRWLL